MPGYDLISFRLSYYEFASPNSQPLSQITTSLRASSFIHAIRLDSSLSTIMKTIGNGSIDICYKYRLFSSIIEEVGLFGKRKTQKVKNSKEKVDSVC